jgi:hypothetical protein
MAEVVSWMESQVYISTGSATASAVVAFAQNTQVNLARGWQNDANAAGTYRDHLTGQRADVTIGVMYTYDGTIQRIEGSATAIHMKLLNTAVGQGSAGVLLWSGRIDTLSIVGSEANPYQYTLACHFNSWSAFGV